MSCKRHGVCYEARLADGKPRRVLCCLSPKQLTVKDYILKFIPKRITSFRLCPSTKVGDQSQANIVLGITSCHSETSLNITCNILCSMTYNIYSMLCSCNISYHVEHRS